MSNDAQYLSLDTWNIISQIRKSETHKTDIGLYYSTNLDRFNKYEFYLRSLLILTKSEDKKYNKSPSEYIPGYLHISYKGIDVYSHDKTRSEVISLLQDMVDRLKNI